jgi:hypothetical protein
MEMYCSKIQNRRVLGASLFFFLLCGLGTAQIAVSLSGCAALKSAQSAPVNQTITTVIADAGTAAITAEAMYNAGTIPQNSTTRSAINDLGAAYNDARLAYQTVLQAEAVYKAAVVTQLAACSPPPSAAVIPASLSGNCTAATTQANAAKVASDTSSANLSSKISVMVSKTSAVKALTAGK